MKQNETTYSSGNLAIKSSQHIVFQHDVKNTILRW